jgi:hypothetical protein
MTTERTACGFAEAPCARLSTQHEKIIHLRGTATRAGPVTRLPAARTAVISSCS